MQNALLIAKGKALSGLLGLSSSLCSISKVPFAQCFVWSGRWAFMVCFGEDL